MGLKSFFAFLFLPVLAFGQGLTEPDRLYLHSMDIYGDVRVRSNNPDSGDILETIDTLGTLTYRAPLRLDSMRIRPSDTVLLLYYSYSGVSDSLLTDFGPFIVGGNGSGGSGGSGGAGGAVGLTNYVGEDLGAYAAYSTRDIGVLGKSMRVRSSTDTSDIGFGQNGILDTARIRALGSKVWAITLYDQSGNGRNLTQPTSSKQPVVFDSSFFFIGGGGRLALKYEATDYMGYQFSSSVAQPNDLYAAYKYDSLPDPGDQSYMQDGNTSTSRQILAFVHTDGNWRYFAGGGSFLDGTADTLAHSWYTSYTNVGNDSVYRDGVLRVADNNVGNAQMGGVSLGGNYLEDATRPGKGRVSELVIWDPKQPFDLRSRLNQYLDTVYVAPRDTTTAWLITLTGQSNADGRAASADLPAGLADTINTSAYIWNGSAWVSLILSNAAGQDWGPELGMAKALYDSMPHRQYYFVKQATGGAELQQSGAEDWSPNSTGEQFSDFQTQYEAAIAAIPVPYEYRANVWIQGEADATDSAWANSYAVNLRHLIDTWHDTVGVTVDWVIGRVNPNINIGTYEGRDIVRAAQELVADERANVYLIDADAFGLLPDNLHYNAAGNVSYGLAIQQILQR